MKWLRLVAALAALGPTWAAAFHEGGVGYCEGCHSAHAQADTGAAPGPWLLGASDPSSTCLRCHASSTPGSYVVMTYPVPQSGLPPQSYTPGGDFAWLRKSYAWLGAKGATETSPGERHGHSVVAWDYDLQSPDGERSTSPGGSYPSDALSCVSCHDPHGQYRVNADRTTTATGLPISGSGSYGGAAVAMPVSGQSALGSYRLLAGRGYAPRSVMSGVGFVYDPPAALAPVAFNQSERTFDVRVAYGRGMSEWCRNCHGTMHTPYSNPASTLEHPSGETALLNTGGELNVYNAYVQTGRLDGSQRTSYSSLVPYEEGTDDRLALASHAVSDGSVRSGPVTGTETVMCLSCHRAHATAWDHATRWNMPAASTIVFGGQWPGVDASGQAGLPVNAQGRSRAETRAAMYDRDPTTYAAFQRVLCNKCHAKD